MKTVKNSIFVNKGKRTRKGAAMVGMIGVILVMGVMGVSMVSLTRSSEHTQLTNNAGSRAFFLAESGLQFAQAVHESEGWRHGRERKLTFQGGEEVNVLRLGNTFWADATVHPDSAMEARARVPLSIDSTLNPPVQPPVVVPVPENGFVVFGDDPFYLDSKMDVLGNIGVVNENVYIKGEAEGDVLGDDVDIDTNDDVKGDVFASGFVDIRNGHITGDVHTGEHIFVRSTGYTSVGGWIFAEGTVYVGSKRHVTGHVHSHSGGVTVYSNASIGTAANPVEVRASGDVVLHSNAKIYGNVYAGGTISGSGTIYGDAYAGSSITGSGSVTGDVSPDSSDYLKLPIAPDLSRLDGLELPDPAVFSVYGNDVVIPRSSAVTLAPGTYCNLYTPSNARGACLYLKAGATEDGNYYLNTITMGKNMNIFLDLSGEHDIRIFTKNNIEVERDMCTFVSSDGVNYHLMTDPAADPELAKRVYWECQCDFLVRRNGWFGTVYTPYGLMHIEKDSHLIGSYYSGGWFCLDGGTATFKQSNYLLEN